jgi:hypothetical protein
MSTQSLLSPSSLQVPAALFSVFKSRSAATAASGVAPTGSSTTVRFVCVSDTHNQLQAHIDAGLIPNGDVFLHAGDFSNKGKPEEVAAFNDALARLPHPVRVWLPVSGCLSWFSSVLLTFGEFIRSIVLFLFSCY